MTSTDRNRKRGDGNGAAPVEYADIRLAYQRTRAGLGLALVALATMAALGEVGTSMLKPAAYAVVVVDAMWRLVRDDRSPWFLAVDLAAAGFAAGFGHHIEPPLVAFIAYLVTAALLLLSTRVTLLLLAGAGALLALRTALLTSDGAPEGGMSEALAWAETAVFLAGLTLVVLAGVREVRRARERQTSALHAEQRASELKNEFVSMVSHELRTPLTNIAGFAMTALETWQDLPPEELNEFLTIICDEAGHLTNVVDDILVIPRLEAGRLLLEPADFRLGPAAFRIADLMFPQGGERSASVSVPGNVMVHADPNRVEQILRNLLENARKYGGNHLSIDALPEPNRWMIVVADNGPGVPEDQREAIFDRFEQLDAGDSRTHGGLGLGLTITRLLVEAMGGEIWYEPGFPIGARFCFTLPAGIGSPVSAARGTGR